MTKPLKEIPYFLSEVNFLKDTALEDAMIKLDTENDIKVFKKHYMELVNCILDYTSEVMTGENNE